MPSPGAYLTCCIQKSSEVVCSLASPWGVQNLIFISVCFLLSTQSITGAGARERERELLHSSMKPETYRTLQHSPLQVVCTRFSTRICTITEAAYPEERGELPNYRPRTFSYLGCRSKSSTFESNCKRKQTHWRTLIHWKTTILAQEQV